MISPVVYRRSQTMLSDEIERFTEGGGDSVLPNRRKLLELLLKPETKKRN